MRTFVKRALWGGAIAGGITLLGATAANAAETDGDDGILSGTQALIPVSVPVDITGNAIALLGTSSVDAPPSDPAPEQASAPAPETAPAAAPAAESSGAEGVASGTQAVVTVDVPVTVDGNAVSVLGSSEVAPAAEAADTTSTAAAPETPSVTTSGTDSVFGGTQALLDVNVPITLTGNAISVLGGSAVTAPEETAAPASSTPAESDAAMPEAATSGSDGVASGTQVVAPVDVPVTVVGNAISVLGTSEVTGASGMAPAGTASVGDVTTDGSDSVAAARRSPHQWRFR